LCTLHAKCWDTFYMKEFGINLAKILNNKTKESTP
jgi:hypothetical protein